MIRQPSSAAQLYHWWTEAVAGNAPDVHDGLPEAGFFKTRLVRGGPWVAVEIKIKREINVDTGELESPERLIAHLDGMTRDPAPIWTHLTPISRDEFRAIINRRETIPAMSATMKPIDLSLEPMTP